MTATESRGDWLWGGGSGAALLAVSLGWVMGLWVIGLWGGSEATLIIFYQNHPQELSFDLSLSD